MSYFAAALSKYLDNSGLTQISFANLTEIDPPSLSRYLKGRIPTKETVEHLVRAIPERERVEIVIGYLKDLIPESAWGLVDVHPSIQPQGRPGKVDRSAKLPKAIQADFDYLMAWAHRSPAVVDSIRSTVRILKGE